MNLTTMLALAGGAYVLLSANKAKAVLPADVMPEGLSAQDEIERQAALAAVQAMDASSKKPQKQKKPSNDGIFDAYLAPEPVKIKPEQPGERFGQYTILPKETPSSVKRPTASKTAKRGKSKPKSVPARTSAQPAQQTPGYDPALARRLAPALAQYIARTQHSADRARIKSFQRAAGIATDGLYGGGTRGALIYFGATKAPRPLSPPAKTITYQPPK